jgi:SAM-dependent methyltransferase
MRPAGRNFVEQIAKGFKIRGPIYEFGSLQVPGQEQLADLRPIFPDHEYVGCDFRKGPGVDIIIDIENMKLPDNSIGTAICVDTLEHVQNVHRAMSEIYRTLKPEGLAVIVSVMNFPIHNYPFDYWRFTPKAFELLLEPFKQKQVISDGDPRFPTGIYGWGVK